MVKKFFLKSKKALSSPQKSVLSAASVIMLMVMFSRVLGLVRQGMLTHFFREEELALFFAAFRLPDLVFEILVYGTFSAAFIPVFAKLVKRNTKEAWEVASTVVNISLLAFVFLATLVSFSADWLYGIIAPGFSSIERSQIVSLTRILFAAQGFFVISYVLTGVLESLRRFLIPALAPLFYNLGIILGTYFLSAKYSLMAPVIGVVAGAAMHFLIQLPLAIKLGFKFRFKIKINEEVKRIGRLAGPRILEISFLQISKMAELFFSSIISTASYTYYMLANSLQLLPIGLFGTSIAKAALPSLSQQSGDMKKFKETLVQSLKDIIFLTLPVATLLIVLRIPIVRLVYGRDLFSWNATVETGLVVSAFAVGVVFQTSIALLARSFYALRDTKTPVAISIFSIFVTLLADYIFIKVLNLPVWGLAAAFSIGGFVQASLLMFTLRRKIGPLFPRGINGSFFKTLFASFFSGSVMFFVLKVFDRSVWVKQLSFLGNIEKVKDLPFEKFVLDTRYTANLLVLTVTVSLMGAIIYLLVSILLKSDEAWRFVGLIKRVLVKKRLPPRLKEKEPVSPTPMETTHPD